MVKIKYNKDGYLNDFHKKNSEEAQKAIDSYKGIEFAKEDFLKQTKRLARDKNK